ncbi:MAG: hypothetical protein J6A29_05355 [Clostridia bacterium]|nr:hypothetical protein [Clostridia bacterium]
MQNVKTIETVKRVTFLNKVACFSIALKLNKINLKNKDSCYGLRLLYLRI